MENEINENLSPKNTASDFAAGELTRLLEENLSLTKEIKIMVTRINKYIAWQQIFSWVRFLLVFVPIIIGFIYLPPLLRDAYNNYLQLLK